MRTILASLLFLSCSGELTAEFAKNNVTKDERVELVFTNDSAEGARWSPCSQAWFIERDGVRERDDTRAYCNLDVALPLGKTTVSVSAPQSAGRFFVELEVRRGNTTSTLEAGPIELIR